MNSEARVNSETPVHPELDRPSLRRVLEDLLCAEIVLLRGSAHTPLPPRPWRDDLPIDAGGLAGGFA